MGSGRLLVWLLLVGCGGGGAAPDATAPDATADGPPGVTDAGLPPTQGAREFRDVVQPLLVAECGSCHLGRRFAFASLRKAGADYTLAETGTNYETFLDQISLDAPRQSRLLAKATGAIAHGGGAAIVDGDATFTALSGWIETEREERCPDCGLAAPRSFIAYVESPRIHWALSADPFRTDHGLRGKARILLQPLVPGTLTPMGDPPVDFLGDGFCGADGRCDFANLAVDHAGTRLAFECRLTTDAAQGPTDARWNVCVAEIGADGRAVNPRFLMPAARRHAGDQAARSDPFGLYKPDGSPLKGPYDKHFQTRRRSDRTPVFSADDRSVILASQGADPDTGADTYQAYHGFEALDHIVSVDVDGTAVRMLYRNEGGVADFPFLLRNGNLAFHTWNLERMDRHLYTQATGDGMMELPVLLGRAQGPNMWGKATQLANGLILGMTGRRRSSIANYVLFAGDHTLGLGLDASLAPIRILDQAVFEQIVDFPTGYCDARANREGPSCFVDRFYADPSWAPDGRALIAYSPERTYVLQGEEMFLGYASGGTPDEAVASMLPYTPSRLGIAAVDHLGAVEVLVAAADGFMLRSPVWVGKRHPERVQPRMTDGSGAAELHIADVPLWLAFRDVDGVDKSRLVERLDMIVAVRVLVKDAGGNACLKDDRPYRHAVNNASYDHPTHLGINNATGYRRLVVPAALGGDAFGDVPLAADRSVRLRVPAGELILVQGIDAAGHVVRQRERVFSMSSGQRADVSVKRNQYASQCGACHGGFTGAAYAPLSAIDTIPLVDLDFTTTSSSVDLADPSVSRRPVTFLGAMRPLLDAKCVSCHAGSAPAGELSLEATYSATGNYPTGKWATTPGHADPAYMAAVPAGSRVPAYNYSVTWAWAMREDESEYKASSVYAPLIASQAPLGDLAPWDPAYQNLFANDGGRFVYLSGFFNSNFGRSDLLGGLSQDSFLLEVLGAGDLDPTRSPGATDHASMVTDLERREIMAVIDTGFAFMGRCDERTVPSGPNAGKPWGDPSTPE